MADPYSYYHQTHNSQQQQLQQHEPTTLAKQIPASPPPLAARYLAAIQSNQSTLTCRNISSSNADYNNTLNTSCCSNTTMITSNKNNSHNHIQRNASIATGGISHASSFKRPRMNPTIPPENSPLPNPSVFASANKTHHNYYDKKSMPQPQPPLPIPQSTLFTTSRTMTQTRVNSITNKDHSYFHNLNIHNDPTGTTTNNEDNPNLNHDNDNHHEREGQTSYSQQEELIQIQPQFMDVPFISDANMQSRNGSTSPSRGRLVRSESYQTRDSASDNNYSDQDKLSSTDGDVNENEMEGEEEMDGEQDMLEQEQVSWEVGGGGGEQHNYNGLKSKSKPMNGHGNANANADKNSSTNMYRRQWTPNQWRNYRIMQQIEAIDGPSSSSSTSYLPASSTRTSILTNAPIPAPLEGNTKQDSNSVDSDDSFTKTDVMTNKSIDMKRRKNWLQTGVNATINNNKNDISKQQKRQQKSQLQEQNENDCECDATSSNRMEAKKPLHYNASSSFTPTTNILTRQSCVNRNSNSLSSPHTLSTTNTPTKKWQVKLKSDRGWIKSNDMNQENITNRNTNTTISNNNHSNRQHMNRVLDVETSSISPVQERKSLKQSWMKKENVKKETSNNTDRGWIKNKNTNQENVKKIDPNQTITNHRNCVTNVETSSSISMEERKSFQPSWVKKVNTKKEIVFPKHQHCEMDASSISTKEKRPASPCNSLGSNPVKKITSLWMDRVNTTSGKKKDFTPKLKPEKTFLSSNNQKMQSAASETSDTSQMKYTWGKVKQRMQSSTSETSDSSQIKYAWGGVKLRRTNEDTSNKEVKHMEGKIVALKDDETINSSLKNQVISSVSKNMTVTERIKKLSITNNIHCTDNFVRTQSISNQQSSGQIGIPWSSFRSAKIQVPDRKIKQVENNQKSEVHESNTVGGNEVSDKIHSSILLYSHDVISKKEPQNDFVPGDKTKSSTTTNDVEFQAVRSRVRSCNENKGSDIAPTAGQYQCMNPSPTCTLKPDKQGKSVTAIKSVQQNHSRPTIRNELPTSTNTQTQPTYIKRKKLGTFLTVPKHGAVSPDHTSSLRNVGPSPSNSTRQFDNLDELRKENLHNDPCNRNNQALSDWKKGSNMSFEFASVQQRIRSLVGEIDKIQKMHEEDMESPEQKRGSNVNLTASQNRNNTMIVHSSELTSQKADKKVNDSITASAQMQNFSALKNESIAESGVENCVKNVNGLKSMFESIGVLQPAPANKNDSVSNWASHAEKQNIAKQEVVPLRERKNNILPASLENININVGTIDSKNDSSRFASNPNAENVQSIEIFTSRDDSSARNDRIGSNDKHREGKTDETSLHLQRSAFTSIRSKFETIGSSPQKPFVKKNLGGGANQDDVKPKTLGTVDSEINVRIFQSIEMMQGQPHHNIQSKRSSTCPSFDQKHLNGNGIIPRKLFHHESNVKKPQKEVPWGKRELNECVLSKNENAHNNLSSIHNTPSPPSHPDYNSNIITPPNDIPWEGFQPKNSVRAPRETAKFVHNQQMIHIDINDEVVNGSHASYYDDDDCDGVTLSPTTSDVSSLSMPTCLHSIGTSSESGSSASSSDEDTGAMESATTGKLSSAKGASEASSSHTSEAATPLIHSTLKGMNMTMNRHTSFSDSTHSMDVKHVSGLLGSIPPLKEDNSFDEGLLLQDSQNPSQLKLDDDFCCKDSDFLPQWEAEFAQNNSDDSSTGSSPQWETFAGFNKDTSLESNKSIKDATYDGSETAASLTKSASIASASNFSTSSSRLYTLKQGLKTTNSEEGAHKRISASNNLSKEQNEVPHGDTNQSMISSTPSDLENKPPSISRKEINKATSNLKRGSTSKRFKAYQLAKRKSFDRMKQEASK